MPKLTFCLSLFSLVAFAGLSLRAEDKPKEEDRGFTVAEGKIAFKAPAGWVKKKPRNNLVEVEYEIPAEKGDEAAGRFSIMGAGGQISDNINRWYDKQFAKIDEKLTKDRTAVEKMTVAGQKVHFVDITGTYVDTPGGPFAGGKPVLRENYRMLAAIIETKNAGNYFLKFYGPKATVAENEKAFKELLQSTTVK